MSTPKISAPSHLPDATAAGNPNEIAPAGVGARRPARRPRKTAGAAGVEVNAGTLCVDIGGSAVKGGTVGSDGTLAGTPVRLPVAYPFSPDQLIDAVATIAAQSDPAARVALGFPGMVRGGCVLSAPHFVTTKGPGTKTDPTLVKAWGRFALSDQVAGRLGLPTRLANDADVQGLAAISGHGLEVVLTLGTGVGTAIFLDGEPAPHLELAHHPLRKDRSYNEVLGDAARRKAGAAKWSTRVNEVVDVVYALTFYDRLYIGGGNAAKLTKAFTKSAIVIDNADGILGGAKLWSLSRLP